LTVARQTRVFDFLKKGETDAASLLEGFLDEAAVWVGGNLPLLNSA